MASVEENPETSGGWGHTYKHVLKLEVVGDTVVGKSSLVLKFTQGKFREQYLPTLGEFLCTQRLQWGACLNTTAVFQVYSCMFWR